MWFTDCVSFTLKITFKMQVKNKKFPFSSGSTLSRSSHDDVTDHLPATIQQKAPLIWSPSLFLMCELWEAAALLTICIWVTVHSLLIDGCMRRAGTPRESGHEWCSVHTRQSVHTILYSRFVYIRRGVWIPRRADRSSTATFQIIIPANTTKNSDPDSEPYFNVGPPS